MLAKTKTKTTRITLDLPKDLHTQIKTLASQNGKTLKQLFIDLATDKLKSKKIKSNKKMPEGIPLGLDGVDLQKIIDESLWPKF